MNYKSLARNDANLAQSEAEFSLSNLTRKKVPNIPFLKIRNKVLGKKYELSLVFCGSTRSRRLNRIYRGKDKPTNVLSFPLNKNSGEIIIDLSRTKPFGPLHLFIHGLLHLKGMQHGGKMNGEEQKLLKIFNGSKHFSRN